MTPILLTKAEEADLTRQFCTARDQLLASIRRAATHQFRYSLKENLPRGILTVAEVVDQALTHGIISTVSARYEYGVEPVIAFAADLLEDVNAHTEAQMLRATIAQ